MAMAGAQYILRKAFDCSPNGKVIIMSIYTAIILIYYLPSPTCRIPSYGGRRSSFLMVLGIRGSTGMKIPSGDRQFPNADPA
jgi:hypothetical protein